MKKLLSLFFVAALSVSAWADYTMVAVTDFTAEYDSYYEYYTISFGSEEGSSNHYKYDISFMIYPETESFVGTFTTEGTNPTLEKNNSKLNWVEGTSIKAKRYLYKATGSSNITIAKVAGKSFTYTMSGTLRARKASGETSDKVYNFTNIEFTCDPYKEEPAKTTINLTGTTLEAYDYMLASDGLVELDIYDNASQQLTLGFMNDKYEIPAGTYNVADTEAKGTILASKGMNGYTPYHSYFYSSSYDYYFVTGGSLTVSYSADNSQMTVSGALTTGHESTINVSVTAANPFYVAPDPETYERNVTAGNFGTICLSRKFTEMTGVDGLYIPAYKDNNVLYCDEVALEDVVAGNGYIFKANAAKVTFTYDLNDSEESASLANNMRGWLATKDTTTLDEYDVTTTFAGYALLAGGQIVSPQAGSKILKNRAMIYLQGVSTEPTQAPARGRRISFGTNTTTGMYQVAGDRLQVAEKRMINGQLIIIRDGVKFNAQGAQL